MGSLLGQYDTEDTILAFGFGAKTKGSKKVNDCFALNVRSGKPEVKGIKVRNPWHKRPLGRHWLGIDPTRKRAIGVTSMSLEGLCYP